MQYFTYFSDYELQYFLFYFHFIFTLRESTGLIVRDFANGFSFSFVFGVSVVFALFFVGPSVPLVLSFDFCLVGRYKDSKYFNIP
jgi:hypothetical protein